MSREAASDQNLTPVPFSMSHQSDVPPSDV